MKIKVAYICQVVNQRIHSHLPLRLDVGTLLLYLKHHQKLTTELGDYGVWNTNAIQEFEKHIDEVELHVITPYPFLKQRKYEYEENGIFYHVFRNDDQNLFHIAYRRAFKRECNYEHNRSLIKGFIKQINPDIVHVMGAELPAYGSIVYDVAGKIPTIVQLQTLMNDPQFKENYSLREDEYIHRAGHELNILTRADYIASNAMVYMDYIRNTLLPNAKFLKIGLPLTEPVNLVDGDKEYDFVYFAADISKAADWAIEAFIMASKQHPEITLDIVGGYSLGYKNQLEARLKEVDLLDKVSFEGKLPSHEDLIKQVRKSKFAVLPMKIDLLTGTIRECMANGIPVVTTITPSSPKQNEKRLSLLLTEKEDYQSMANNMCKLLEDDEFAEMIRHNALVTASERVSNSACIDKWLAAYKAVLDKKINNTPFSEELMG